MTEQQELFFVVAGIEDEEIFGYLADKSDEIYVNEIESPGILVFRTPEVAEDVARTHSDCGECKVIQVHRDFLDVAAVPDEPIEIECPELKGPVCPTCECSFCRCGG
jgi:hypothetical protein